MNILSCRPIPEKYPLDVMNCGCPASTVPPAPDGRTHPGLEGDGLTVMAETTARPSSAWSAPARIPRIDHRKPTSRLKPQVYIAEVV
jgi:hypothetical protein